jgi:hypothetical protein
LRPWMTNSDGTVDWSGTGEDSGGALILSQRASRWKRTSADPGGGVK